VIDRREALLATGTLAIGSLAASCAQTRPQPDQSARGRAISKFVSQFNAGSTESTVFAELKYYSSRAGARAQIALEDVSHLTEVSFAQISINVQPRSKSGKFDAANFAALSNAGRRYLKLSFD
jgi:hypothetical protein